MKKWKMHGLHRLHSQTVMEMTSFYNALMFRAHSFPRKFSQASSQNFAAHHGKIVQILRLTMVFYLCIN